MVGLRGRCWRTCALGSLDDALGVAPPPPSTVSTAEPTLALGDMAEGPARSGTPFASSEGGPPGWRPSPPSAWSGRSASAG